MTALSGHQRGVSLQVRTYLMAEDRDRVSADAAILWCVLSERFLYQIKILLHGPSEILLLRTMAISPNHHDSTRKHHRDRRNLPHTDVLHPAVGELGAGLAEEFRDDTE